MEIIFTDTFVSLIIYVFMRIAQDGMEFLDILFFNNSNINFFFYYFNFNTKV